jgi:hypothetical protein
MKYYRKNSDPLVPMTEEKIKAGEIVYNELGKCVKKIYVDDNIYFVEVVESVLNEGETLSSLTPLQLELFWKLSNNKFKKHEDKNKDPRRYLFS